MTTGILDWCIANKSLYRSVLRWGLRGLSVAKIAFLFFNLDVMCEFMFGLFLLSFSLILI